MSGERLSDTELPAAMRWPGGPTTYAELAKEVKAGRAVAQVAHDHRTHVAGCYRCDLSRDEYLAQLEDEVQELRHLRDNVLPDLRQELDNANAALEASRKLVADLRAVHRGMRCCEIVPCHTVSMIDEAGL